MIIAAPPVRARLTAWLEDGGYASYRAAAAVERACADRHRAAVIAAPRDTPTTTIGGCGAEHQLPCQTGETPGSAVKAASAGSVGLTLITYLPGPDGIPEAGPTAAAVTAALLRSRRPRPFMWLQLARMPLGDARSLGLRAGRCGVSLIHAPYLQDPASIERPPCVVYSPTSARGRLRADALVRALSRDSGWIGPLHDPSPPLGSDLLDLGD